MLPTERMRKGGLRTDFQGGVGGYHSLVEGGVQGVQGEGGVQGGQGEGSFQVQGAQTAEEQNCTIASNLPLVGH